ncbi:MAG: hypothetical protein ACJLS2_13185 [Microcella pacifica]
MIDEKLLLGPGYAFGLEISGHVGLHRGEERTGGIDLAVLARDGGEVLPQNVVRPLELVGIVWFCDRARPVRHRLVELHRLDDVVGREDRPPRLHDERLLQPVDVAPQPHVADSGAVLLAVVVAPTPPHRRLLTVEGERCEEVVDVDEDATEAQPLQHDAVEEDVQTPNPRDGEQIARNVLDELEQADSEGADRVAKRPQVNLRRRWAPCRAAR